MLIAQAYFACTSLLLCCQNTICTAERRYSLLLCNLRALLSKGSDEHTKLCCFSANTFPKIF